MMNFNKFLKKIWLKKETILLCYFDSKIIHYTPLDIGYILAILKKNGLMRRYEFEIVPLNFSNFLMEKFESIVAKDSQLIYKKKPRAVFIFLDNILWSSVFALGRAKKIARAIKKNHPEIFIGLQSYKFRPENMTEIFSYHQVDCVVKDNPENSFLFLEKILRKEKVSKVIYGFGENGSDQDFCQNFKEKKNEEKNLDFIPSAFLSGVLDNFFLPKSKETAGKFVCFIQTSRGCRFGCYYCWRSVKFESVRFFSAQRFYDEIEYLNSHFGFFRFFVLDDAFLFSLKRLREFESEFERRKLKNPKLKKILFFAMTRAESLNEEIIEILKNLGVSGIQVGLQTVNSNLAHYMNRNIKLEKFENISQLLEKWRIGLSLDIIVGLPGDTLEYLEKTINFAVSLKPKNIQVKQLFLNPGTRFYQEREKYEIQTEKIEHEFEVPFVISSKGGTNARYNAQAYNLLVQMPKIHPLIRWKIITYYGKYRSRHYGIYD